MLQSVLSALSIMKEPKCSIGAGNQRSKTSDPSWSAKELPSRAYITQTENPPSALYNPNSFYVFDFALIFIINQTNNLKAPANLFYKSAEVISTFIFNLKLN